MGRKQGHIVGVLKDKDYQAWVRRQPSCISGQYSEWVNGEGRCEFAHVRRAAKGGTGYKPKFSGVPLTREEHRLQHEKGEAYVLAANGIITEDAKAWFDEKAAEYLRLWQCKQKQLKMKY